MTQSIVAAGSDTRAEQDQVKFHVAYNNLPGKAGLQTGWGFACLIGATRGISSNLRSRLRLTSSFFILSGKMHKGEN